MKFCSLFYFTGIDYEKLVTLVNSIPSSEYMDLELDRNKLGNALSFVYREGAYT